MNSIILLTGRWKGRAPSGRGGEGKVCPLWDHDQLFIACSRGKRCLRDTRTAEVQGYPILSVLGRRHGHWTRELGIGSKWRAACERAGRSGGRRAWIFFGGHGMMVCGVRVCNARTGRTARGRGGSRAR